MSWWPKGVWTIKVVHVPYVFSPAKGMSALLAFKAFILIPFDMGKRGWSNNISSAQTTPTHKLVWGGVLLT